MPIRAKVAVVGGDSAVGGALVALLESAGYRAEFLDESVLDGLGEHFAESVQLLIIAPPALSAERRQAVLDVVRSPALVQIPVLELLPANGDEHFEGHVVLWPCSLVELKRAIDAAMATQR